jgi:hypothetical protein
VRRPIVGQPYHSSDLNQIETGGYRDERSRVSSACGEASEKTRPYDLATIKD